MSIGYKTVRNRHAENGKNKVCIIVFLCFADLHPSKWPSGAPDGHLLGVTIPDAASIQFNLLMMRI